MTFSCKKFGEHCIIDLPHNIFTKKKIEALKITIEENTENGFKIFLLNMGQLSKINDDAIEMLLGLYKIAFYQEINLKLYNLQPYVSQLIFQTRMNIIFDICEKNDELLKNNSSLEKLIAS